MSIFNILLLQYAPQPQTASFILTGKKANFSCSNTKIFVSSVVLITVCTAHWKEKEFSNYGSAISKQMLHKLLFHLCYSFHIYLEDFVVKLLSSCCRTSSSLHQWHRRRMSFTFILPWNKTDLDCWECSCLVHFVHDCYIFPFERPKNNKWKSV